MKTSVSNLLCCGLLGLCPAAAMAQGSPQALLSEARLMLEGGQFQAAETRAETAYNLLKSTENAPPEELAEAASLTGLAACKLEKYGGAQPFLLEAIGIWEKMGQGSSLPSAKAWHALANCRYYRDKANEALEAAHNAWEIRSALLPPDHCDLAETQRLLGKIRLQTGEYAQAKAHFSAAVAIAKTCAGEESIPVADALSGLGTAAIRLSQYDSAVALQEQALAVRLKLLPPGHPDLALSYLSLGEAHKLFYKFDLAHYYYEKALTIRLAESDNRGSAAIAYAFSEMGQYHLAKKDYAAARTCFERENDIMVGIGATESSSYAYTCSDLTRLYFSLQDYEQATLWADRMVAVWRKNSPSPNTQLAAMLTYAGRAKWAKGDTGAAQADFQESKQLYTDLVGADSYLASKADFWLGNVFFTKFLQSRDAEALQQARAHFALATTGAENQVRQETNTDAQRKIWAESVPAFEKALEAEHRYWSLHPDEPESLEKAWQLCEAVHGQLLVLASQEANARHFADIPDEHLERDSTLRAQIVALEKERQQMLQKLALTDAKVLALNAEIFAQKETLEKHRAWIEQHYPEYYQLKHARQQMGIAQAQAMLRPGQTLLEYFTGDSALYVFALRADTARLFRLPKHPSLENWAAQCREGITGYHTAAEPAPGLYEKMLRQYAQAAQQLYAALLAPLADWLSPELLLVPDDKLAGLPFEALLQSVPRDLSNFVTYPFLLRQHSVQYAYSAALWQQMSARQYPSPARGVLAMAPFFEGKSAPLASRQSGRQKRDDLSPLPYSGEEVARVKKRFGADALVCTGAAATDSFFLANAGRYSTLHLATHGKANHKAGEFSYLAFAGKAKPALFSVGELYNLRLNADLVVLSACETAIGEQQRGDGVVSMSRAFAYAGAKTVLATLWSANDRSTMLLVDAFYDGLHAGKAKHIALADAKRQYLSQSPGSGSHPFFWAAFVGVGAW